jgi:hypothetical protein
MGSTAAWVVIVLTLGACGYLVREKRKRDDFILAASSARVDPFGERTVSIWITLAVLRRRTMTSCAVARETRNGTAPHPQRTRSP